MPFPRPPRPKDNPAGPRLPPELRPKHPDRAAAIVLMSMVFWAVLSVGALSLILWVVGPVLRLVRYSGLFLTGALMCAAWVGLGVGWRIGNLVVIAALRGTQKPSGHDAPHSS